jgi:hypothetical protein
MATADETAAAFIGLPDTLGQIIELGIGDPDELRKLPREILGVIAFRSREGLMLWSLADLPPEEQDSTVDQRIGLGRIVLAYASHYQIAAQILVDQKDEHSVKALAHPDTLDALTARAGRFSSEADLAAAEPVLAMQVVLAALTRSLLGCWTLIAAIRWWPRDIAQAALDDIRAAAVEGLALIFQIRDLEEAALLEGVVAAVASPTAEGLTDALKTGGLGSDVAEVGFAALRLQDLPRLASRKPAMRKIYGMSVERAYERQLALLFTSLGLAVIESTPGKRHVDLLCVAAAPEPATLVVEAKSTSAAEYTLRADAQRALVEHVKGVQRALRGLPPLALILIVAPCFSVGAAKRIREVSRETHVPCYGFPAALLAFMRERHVGPIPFDVLVDEICNGPDIVDITVVERILRIAVSWEASWKQFVNIQRHARERD